MSCLHHQVASTESGTLDNLYILRLFTRQTHQTVTEPGVGVPPCNKCPHAVQRDASSIHHQPALPPPVSSSALMLLLLLPGAKLAGSQPWKMLCWKGLGAYAWLLLSGGNEGLRTWSPTKWLFFSFLFWGCGVKSVCVVLWWLLGWRPSFSTIQRRQPAKQRNRSDGSRCPWHTSDSSAEHLALQQHPYCLLFGSLHSGHTPHLKWQTVFYLLPHEFIQFWCNWSGYSTFISKYSGIVLQPFCFLFPQSTKVTQPKWGGHWQRAEGTNHMNKAYEHTEPNQFLEILICKPNPRCVLLRPLVYDLGGRGCHLWIGTVDCHQSSPSWTSWTVDLIQV